MEINGFYNDVASIMAHVSDSLIINVNHTDNNATVIVMPVIVIIIIIIVISKTIFTAEMNYKFTTVWEQLQNHTTQQQHCRVGFKCKIIILF